MDQCTHEVRAEYWKKIIQACGQRLNITVQNRPEYSKSVCWNRWCASG